MSTNHQTIYGNAADMSALPEKSVALVVTSPPYPMIAMWDASFSQQNPEITSALHAENGTRAFELMHQQLDLVWNEVYRVLIDGGIACINIGDATRTINSSFCLYANHARILQHLTRCGFTTLPSIIWSKQSNAPNKFMGSGMLPGAAYVTLEHEHILIVRKGTRREFPKGCPIRKESALFWEERNRWYSDVWSNIQGASQQMAIKKIRLRSAAYPFEIPYRLISMYSIKQDMVLDPFLGLGTTSLAAMACERNSIGFEIESDLKPIVGNDEMTSICNKRIEKRIMDHSKYISNTTHKEFKHSNTIYSLPVMTQQETAIHVKKVKSILTTSDSPNRVITNYVVNL